MRSPSAAPGLAATRARPSSSDTTGCLDTEEDGVNEATVKPAIWTAAKASAAMPMPLRWYRLVTSILAPVAASCETDDRVAICAVLWSAHLLSRESDPVVACWALNRLKAVSPPPSSKVTMPEIAL